MKRRGAMWGQLPSYLEGAEAAARWIRSAARQAAHGLVWLPEPDHPERAATVTAPPTIYSGNAGIVLFLLGLAGTAFVLAHAGRATGDERHRAAALAITRHIAAAARPAGVGVEWTGAASAALGDGAILLYLLWAARAFDDAALRDLARRAGERLVELAEPDPRGGLKWRGLPP